MSDKTASLLRRIASVVLIAATLLCAIAFSVACVQIYRSGDRPFTPESIGAAWKTIAIFFYLTIVLVLGTGILHLLYPAPAKKQKGTSVCCL